ncbi:MAG: hypothetical protein A4E50_00610 [Methanosaeta sp. PtaB.Bin087]|nr:MAG: hypothetical protein A4E50_00610 [Methanosaeta sp. PtaB.Bin087]
MKLWSGAILSIAIMLLCLGLAQAYGENDDDFFGNLGEDYLNYAGQLYGASGSSEGYSSSFSYSQYFQYFFSEDEVFSTDHRPVGFTITGNEPSFLYFGWQTVPYSTYASSEMYGGSNELWIEGSEAWTRYAACPVGTWLQLITTTPSGGSAEFYEVSPSGNVGIVPYTLGTYDRMSFYAGEQGRYALFFVSNGLASNVVIVDVGAELTPDMIGGSSATTSAPTPAAFPSAPAPAPGPAPVTTSGDVRVTLESQRMRGYDVYVDEQYVGTDGKGGDALDGIYKVNVVGGMWHTIKVWDGEWFYGKPRFYQRNTPVVLKFEPATTVYVYGGMW